MFQWGTMTNRIFAYLRAIETDTVDEYHKKRGR